MQAERSLEGQAAEMDFAALLEASFQEDTLERGDITVGTVLAVDSQGLIVGVGSHRDGFVSRKDIERLGVRVENLDRHFGQAAKDVAEIRISAEKAGRRAKRLDNFDFEEIAPAEAVPPVSATDPAILFPR